MPQTQVPSKLAKNPDQPMDENLKSEALAVVIVNYNGLQDTLECLDSLNRCDDQNYTAIVVDNGSYDFCDTQIHDVAPDAIVIRNEKNLGWSGGNNVGIREAMRIGAKWIVLLNNDTRVSRYFVTRHLKTVERFPDLGIYGPIINEYEATSKQQTASCHYNPIGFEGFLQSQNILPVIQSEPVLYPTDIVNGCCLFVSREVIEKIGEIDDLFFLIHEESDFCLRAQEAGCKLGILAEPLVWHKHSVSFQRAGKPLQRYYSTRNYWLLLRKHRGGHNRKGRIATCLTYFRHAYYMYSHESDLENEPGSFAVCEGLCDAFAGRFGKRRELNRPLAKTIAFFYSTAKWLRTSTRKAFN